MKYDPQIVRDLEARALDDYQRALGTVVEVLWVTGYPVGKHGDSVDVAGPFRVRVLPTSQVDIEHWNDEWLDPYWNIEPAQHYPELDGLTSLWAFGTSYSLDGQVHPVGAAKAIGGSIALPKQHGRYAKPGSKCRHCGAVSTSGRYCPMGCGPV